MSRLMDELTGENHAHDGAPTDATSDVATPVDTAHDGDRDADAAGSAPADDAATSTGSPAIVVPGDDVDLDKIAAGLDAVAAALQRLDDGSYGIDHVTGQPIDDAVLAADPTATRTP